MDFLLSTGSLWSYSIERCFDFAAEAGFDGIELMVDQRWGTRQADFLRRQMEHSGLPVVAVHSPFWHNVPGWPSDSIGRLQASVQLAEAVGANVVVHHLPMRVGRLSFLGKGHFFQLPVPFWGRERSYRRWLQREYGRLRAKTDVSLCIENMPAYRRFGRRWNLHYWNTPREIETFADVTLDTTHLGTWGLEPVEVYRRLDQCVSHVHLSNYDGREHRRPEAGNLRLDALLRQMVADGYDGAVSLELFPEVIDAGGPDSDVVARLATSLACCREWSDDSNYETQSPSTVS